MTPIGPEDIARESIDAQLNEAGWTVQDFSVLNLHAARGVAVRQFPLKPGHGFAFHRPDTLSGMIPKTEIAAPGQWQVSDSPPPPYGANPADTLRGRVRSMPPLPVEGLWPAQVTAVRNLETSLAANHHKSKQAERFRPFTCEELTKRDKTSLDIFWLKDDSLEDSDNLPAPEVIAAEIAEDLEAAL